MAHRQAVKKDHSFASEASGATPFATNSDKLLIDSSACQIVFSLFKEIQRGRLSVQLPDGATFFFGRDDLFLRAKLIIKHPLFFERVVKEASLGLGESYMDGWWDVQDNQVAQFIGIMLCNKLHEKIKGHWGLLLKATWHRISNLPTTIALSRQCIKRHYDLGNEFFAQFLDSSMTYSCGYQKSSSDTLEQMQSQKYQLINEKLRLKRGGHLLDIGCGWGGMLIQAARKYENLRCTGVTISEEQFALAKERVGQANLSDRIKVKLLDYRQLLGKYDYVVSIGMFEHVGRKQYPIFMQRVFKLLKTGGIGLLHTIGLTDQEDIPTDPWIEKYIFPGGRLPRLQEIVSELQKANMVPVHVENLRPHYAMTLNHWSRNFTKNGAKIGNISLAYDQRFMRMWSYYLHCCEAAFRYGSNQLYQVLFCRSGEWPFRYKVA